MSLILEFATEARLRQIVQQYACEASASIGNPCSLDGRRLARLRLQAALRRGLKAETVKAIAKAHGLPVSNRTRLDDAAELLALCMFPPAAGEG